MSGCAFLFPGQGAQAVGMGRELAAAFPEARNLLERAEAHLQLPLGEIMFAGPEERLNEDFTAQVAVFTVSCMAAEVLAARGIRAGAMAPYSSGLYAAAYAAGALSFEAGLSLMRQADHCIRRHNRGGGIHPDDLGKISLANTVTPAKTGVQQSLEKLDSDLRRNDSLGLHIGVREPKSTALAPALPPATGARERWEPVESTTLRGTMGVVLGLSAAEVEDLCAQVDGVVEVSIINTHHQIIVSGQQSAVAALLQRATVAGALKTGRLPAAAPYHCSLLATADQCLAEWVAQTPLADPHTPIISYIDAAGLASAPAVAMLLSNQLGNPVHWTTVVADLVRRGLTPMVEIGPGQMLGRCVRWIHRRATVLNTETAAALEAAVDALTT